MAYNPFSSFRKYQKFWMASILLLCMVTFVLCTGSQGDLSSILVNMFSSRHGTVYAKLDGRSIYHQEFDALKQQRNVANEFMLRAARSSLTKAENILKQETEKGAAGKEGQARKAMMTRLMLVQKDLQIRLLRPRYFDGGVKLEELADFLMWRDIADKLGIELSPETLQEMVFVEVLGRIPLGGNNSAPLFDGYDFRQIQRELHRGFQNVTEAAILQAVKDEFRVRLAQLALMTAQPEALTNPLRGQANEAGHSSAQALLKFKVTVPPMAMSLNQVIPLVDQVRAPLTPLQMWDIYKQKRADYDIAIVPIHVDKFLDQIREPSESELKLFFDENKKTPYDPSAATPGFMIPAQVKVAWIAGDPNSKYYQGLAQTVSQLEMAPPVGWSPAYPALVAAVRYGAGAAAFEVSMARNYEAQKKSIRRQFLADAPITEASLPVLLAHVSKPTPDAVASLIAAAACTDAFAACPVAYRARQYRVHGKELAPLAAAEDRARIDFAAQLAGLSAAPCPLTPLGLLGREEYQERFLPLGAVFSELKKDRESLLAHNWVDVNMIAVKERLEQLQGKETAMNIALRGNQDVQGFIKKYGLEHNETKEFRSPFNIEKAPELAPLRESFDKYRFEVNSIEGRAGKQERLKEGDFPRLFFDNGEPFSVAGGRYIARPWPPTVEVKSDSPNAPVKTIPLFDSAEKPFLFWKIDDKDSRTPDSVQEVRKKVVLAWKMKKAREKFAVQEAAKVAQEIIDSPKKAGVPFGIAVRAEALKLQTSPIYLNNVSDMVPEHEQFTRIYHEFTLPKDMFTYPREDMAKQLLALTKLGKGEKPLKTGYTELDNLNEKLSKEKDFHQIQVLTNKPQDTFYVAVVTAAIGANKMDFAMSLKKSSGFGETDVFVQLAHDEAAKEFRRALTAQLRQQTGYEILADAEARKSFDAIQSAN